MNPEYISEIMKLSVAERILLVEKIWDSIAEDPDTIPVPEHHQEILKERYEEYLRNPDAGAPWEEVRDRIRKAT